MPLLVLPTNHQSRNITTEKMIEQQFSWLYDIGVNGHV